MRDLRVGDCAAAGRRRHQRAIAVVAVLRRAALGQAIQCIVTIGLRAVVAKVACHHKDKLMVLAHTSRQTWAPLADALACSRLQSLGSPAKE
jgi:hypothetical protein